MAELQFKRKRKPDKQRRSRTIAAITPSAVTSLNSSTTQQNLATSYRSGPYYNLGARAMTSGNLALAQDTELQYEELSEPAEALEYRLQNSAEGDRLRGGQRDELERRFGRPLGHIQLHQGPIANKLTSELGTRAFAWRQHIWLGEGEDSKDTRLLAHEITHVVQQGYAPQAPDRLPIGFSAPANDPFNTSPMNRAPDPPIADSGVAESGATQAVHPAVASTPAAPVAAVQGFDLLDAAADIGGAIYDTAGDAVEFVGEVAEDIADWGIDRVKGLLREVIPDFLRFFENGGITGFINDIVTRGLESLFTGVLRTIKDVINVDGFGAGFTEAVAWFEAIGSEMSANTCDAVLGLASNIREFFSETFGPIVNDISNIACTVKGFISGAVDSLVMPIWDFLREIGGEVWQALQAVISDIGDLIGDAKELLGRAWDTAKSWFGIEAEEGESEGGGIWNWVKGIAEDIGRGISDLVQPILGPMRDVAGVLLLFVPGGQIVAVMLLWPRLRQAFDWISGVWEDLNLIARMREFLVNTVFPFMEEVALGMAQSMLIFAELLVNGMSSFVGFVQRIVSGIPDILMPFRPIVNFFLGLGQKMLGFARTGIRYVSRHLRSILRRLLELLQILGRVLMRLISIVVNPFGLVGFLVGTLWQLLPDCLKAPLINFILDIMIGFVRLFPNSVMLGVLWPLVQNAILGFLETVRALELKPKVSLSNKVANIIAGGSITFIIGYFRGIIVGLWNTIAGPFQAIAAVFELPGQIREFLGNLGISFCELINQIRCFAGQLVGQVFGSVDSVIDAIREFLSDPARILSLIQCAFQALSSGASKLGSQLAKHMIKVFQGPDEEIGNQLGQVTAQVLIQVGLAIFTAGAGNAVVTGTGIISRIANVLRTVGRAIRGMMRMLRGLLGRLVRFLRGIASRFGQSVARGGRSVLGRLGGFFRRFTRWLARIGRRMFRGIRRRFRLSAGQRMRWRLFNQAVSNMFRSHPRGVRKATLRREYAAVRARFRDVAKWPAFITKQGPSFRVWARRVKSFRPRRAGSLVKRDVLMDARSREIAGARAVRREVRQLKRRETYISTREVTSAINPIDREYELETLRTRPVNAEQSFDVTIQATRDETIPQKWPRRNEIVRHTAGRSAIAVIMEAKRMTSASPYSDNVYNIKQHRRGNVRSTTGNSLYIRGHIIHGSFAHGGASNLTPLTRIANSRMRRTGERAALSSIREQRRDRRSRNKERKARAVPIRYEVTTNNPGSGTPPKRFIAGSWRGCGYASETSLVSKVVMKVYKARYTNDSWDNRGQQIGETHNVENVPYTGHHTMHQGPKGRGYPIGWKEAGGSPKDCDE